MICVKCGCSATKDNWVAGFTPETAKCERCCCMKTPEVNNLTSKPLIFVVEGKVYAGHYHSNGWFYNDCKRYKEDLFMAKGPNPSRGMSCLDLNKYKFVTEWHYLN